MNFGPSSVSSKTILLCFWALKKQPEARNGKKATNSRIKFKELGNVYIRLDDYFLDFRSVET